MKMSPQQITIDILKDVLGEFDTYSVNAQRQALAELICAILRDPEFQKQSDIDEAIYLVTSPGKVYQLFPEFRKMTEKKPKEVNLSPWNMTKLQSLI